MYWVIFFPTQYFLFPFPQILSHIPFLKLSSYAYTYLYVQHTHTHTYIYIYIYTHTHKDVFKNVYIYIIFPWLKVHCKHCSVWFAPDLNLWKWQNDIVERTTTLIGMLSVLTVPLDSRGTADDHTGSLEEQQVWRQERKEHSDHCIYWNFLKKGQVKQGK